MGDVKKLIEILNLLLYFSRHVVWRLSTQFLKHLNKLVLQKQEIALLWIWCSKRLVIPLCLNFYWVRPQKIVTYILNQIPSKLVWKTPYELWSSKKPSLHHFHIRGCKVEIRDYNPQQKKLDPKTITRNFVDYCVGSRGFRFYYLLILLELLNPIELFSMRMSVIVGVSRHVKLYSERSVLLYWFRLLLHRWLYHHWQGEPIILLSKIHSMTL